MNLELVEEVRTIAPGISEQEFAKFYADHLPRVKAFLVRQGCEASLLDDLAQETFLRAWNGRNQFARTSTLGTWVFGIARNAAREQSRKKVISLPIDQDQQCKTSAFEVDEEDLMRHVRLAVSRLPPKQRIAISLVYFSGLSQIKAAQQSCCAPAAFRRRLGCGRMRLREMLARTLPSPRF